MSILRLSQARYAPQFVPWTVSSTFGSRASNNTALATKEPVPPVMVTFGNPPNSMTFVSHPGVMAIVKLLEMKFLVSSRARLVQENVDAIAEFDAELAQKCQLAVDAGIDINFMELEYINKPEFLQKFLHEKELLAAARVEVLGAPIGTYRVPYYARRWEKPEVPRKWRPETAITADILSVEPDLIKDIELQGIVSEYLRQKPVDIDVEFENFDPIFAAADSEKETAYSEETAADSATTTPTDRAEERKTANKKSSTTKDRKKPTKNSPPSSSS